MAPHFKRNTAGSKYTSDGLFFHLNPNYKPSTRPPAQNHRKRIHKSLSLMSLVDAPQSPEPEIAYRAPAARMHAGLTTQLPSNIVQDASRANRTAVAPQDIFKMSYTTPITATDEDIFMMTELVSTEDDDIVEVDIEIARSSSKAERRDVSPDPRPPKKAKSRPSTPDDDCPIPKPTPDDVYGISEEPGNRAPDRKLRDRTKKVPDKSYKRESPKIPIQGYSLKKLDNYKYPVKVVC
jgi:hypothetical protein